MKKLLLLFLLAFLAVPIANAEESVVTLTTTLDEGASIKLYTWADSMDDAFTIDWGDGVEKIYNKVKPSWTYGSEITGKLGASKTITIKGDITYLEIKEMQISAATFANTKLKEVDMEKNQLTDFNLSGLPEVTKLSLNENSIVTFSSTGNSVLKNLGLKSNKIDSHQFEISSLANSLEQLNVSENGENFVALNLINFDKLQYFTANDNPELTTVVFYDGSTNLKQISMNNCHIMHFYAISLPNLSSLNLSNNALLDFENGTYPNLSTLSVNGNYLSEIDVTKFPKLFSFDCSSNQLTDINVANNPELNYLNCGNNKLTSVDVSTNKELGSLLVNGNSLSRIDISNNESLGTINISDTQISYIDLTKTKFLRDFRAANTLCPFFYFNYVLPGGKFSYLDMRNNSKMTGNSMTFTLHTLPALNKDAYNTNLFVEGSNAETADTEYVTSNEMKWKIDVTGDGTANCPAVPVTVKANDTGEKVNVTGYFGGDISNERNYNFTKYSTTHGSFYLSQWAGNYYQELADVTTTAKAGVAIMVNDTPDEGYMFDHVVVNGESIYEKTFVVNEESTIEVVFRGETSTISFTAPIGQSLSFALAAEGGNKPTVSIDWGNGSSQEYEVSSKNYVRIDGVAAAPADQSATMSTVTIKGEVFALNLESYGEFGEKMGLWNNKISGIDLSKTNILNNLNLYMNPIRTIDVSGQPFLLELDASYCELKEIDVTHNPELRSFSCYGNSLTSVDLSKNPELLVCNVKVNQLEAIDLSNNPKLEEVNVANNYLTAIDLSMLPALGKATLMNNELTTVDLSHNPELIDVSVGGNLLTSLDLTANKKVQMLSFNDNAIRSLDLSANTDLYKIDCGGNGMTACELNDFFYTLPQRAQVVEEQPSANLTLLTGTEATPNDAENSDTSIASEKGWTPSMSGNGSGCDVARLIIAPTVNGSIELKDAEGKVINSGDKVKRMSPITIKATPDAGYELDKITANSKVIEGNEFKISRNTTVTALFKVMGSVSDVALDGVAIAGADGAVRVSVASDSKVEIFDVNGRRVFAGNISAETTIPMATGYYAVRVENADGSMARIVSVK